MDSFLLGLLQVEDIDAKLKRVAEHRGGSRLGEFELRLGTAVQKHEQLRVRLQEDSSSQQLHESQLAKLESHLQQLNSKLYSGKVTNSRELSSLEEEFKAGQAERSELEEKVLQLMEGVEQGQGVLVRLERDIAVLREDVEEARRDEVERQALLDQRQADLERARACAWSALPEDIRAKYDRLCSIFPDPVARVKGGVCLGCRMDVPSSHWRGVKQGQLLNCPTCGRFLREPEQR